MSKIERRQVPPRFCSGTCAVQLELLCSGAGHIAAPPIAFLFCVVAVGEEDEGRTPRLALATSTFVNQTKKTETTGR